MLPGGTRPSNSLHQGDSDFAHALQWAKSSGGSTNWTNVGTNSPSYTPADGDVRHYLRATVSYTDGHGPNKSAQAVSDNAVQAGANRPPEFGAAPAIRKVPENTEAGENVGAPVVATDPDTGNTLTYTLEGTDAGSFSIVGASGQIQTKSGVTYDHETKPNHSVTVEADDGNGGADTIAVTIDVTDVNEPPEFPSTETGTRSIPENTEVGQDIGDPVTANDPDAGDTLTYTLDSAGAASFDIDTSSGQLQTKAGLDFETTPSYTVTVSVRDSKDDNGNTDTATDDEITVTIAVTNVNEPPEFPSTETGARSVAENTAAGENIGSPVTATDPDADTLTYSLDSAGAASFDIDTSTGQLKTKAALNYETKSSYSVTVTATDTSNATETIAVTITVTDVNEAPKVNGDASKNYPENGTGPVASYTATDPEKATIEWTLSGDDAGDFSISTGGVLKFSTSPDFEDPADTGPDNVYNVTIEASDGSNIGMLPVTVTVTDENEAPKLTGEASINYAENGAGPVHTYAATDPESGTIDWSVTGIDSDGFSIDGGVLTFNSPPNFEAPTDASKDNEYLVTVQASDGTNPVTVTVTVTVTDVNEAPAFAIETATRSVAENTAAGQDIGLPVTATDPDAGDSLAYTLGGADAGSFTIVELTGQLETKATLDHETKDNYTVIVTATDSSSATDTITVTITITDVNEPPAFTAETDTRTVAENTAAGENIGSPFPATDPDADATLTYTLGGDDAGSFTIIESSGQLQTSDALDYEYKDSYTVIVSVLDSKAADDTGDSAPDDTITVTVAITNVDEDGTVTLSSLQPQVDAVLTATLDDPDGDVSGETWVWARFPRGGQWTGISGATSASYTPVADDVGKILRATVSYTDGHGSGKTEHEVSDNAVQAAPPNNDPPTFSAETSDRTIAENTAAGEDIGEPVTATDPNSDTLTYSLGGTDATSFGIVQTTGQLQTKAALDFENKETYTVTVTATDPSGESDSITVTINVTNVDEAPDIGFSASIDYLENHMGKVASYTATDPEGASITWKLSGDDSEDFHISTGGELTFKTPPDHEAPVDADD